MDMMIKEEIRDKEIRLIGQDGEQLGIMPTKQALEMAEEKELDLVKIAPTAKPAGLQADGLRQVPFRARPREKKKRGRTRRSSLSRESSFRPPSRSTTCRCACATASSSFRAATRSRSPIRFRGRMITHSDVGLGVMNEFYSRVKDYAVMDRKPSTEGRTMTMMLSPKQDK